MGEADDRPWERPGCVRRDCEPHRATLLSLLGLASLLSGLASVCLVVPALPGLVLGVVAWEMGQRDRARMRAGAMDPRGLKRTEDALGYAAAGSLLSLAVLAVWGVRIASF